VLDAYILIESYPGNTVIVAVQVQTVPGVVKTEIVTGPYDVIARAQAQDMDALAKRVTAQIQALPGVMRTATCIIGQPSFPLSGPRSRGVPISHWQAPFSHWQAPWNRHHTQSKFPKLLTGK
jgi:Lrp/AsnC ligand binding domain